MTFANKPILFQTDEEISGY